VKQLAGGREFLPEPSGEQEIQTKAETGFKNIELGLLQVRPTLAQMIGFNEDMLLLR